MKTYFLAFLAALFILGFGCAWLIGRHQATPQPASVAVAAPAVWNKVNPPDMTIEVAKSAGAGGHIILHLHNVVTEDGIDNVQVYVACEVPAPDMSVYPAHAHAGSFVVGNVGFKGDKTFDMTDKFASLLAYNPPVLVNLRVEFVVTPQSHKVRLKANSFDVGYAYFEIIDKDGKPVPQPKILPVYGNQDGPKTAA